MYTMWLIGLVVFVSFDITCGAHLNDASNKITATTPDASQVNGSFKQDSSHSNSCPATCTCNQDRTISCIGDFKDVKLNKISSFWKLKKLTLFGGISQIPTELSNFTEIEYLNLSGNSIKSISKSSLEKHGQITHLDLSHNEISELHKDSFVNLQNLTFLNLKRNKIRSLPDSLFVKNNLLEAIDLSYNLISQLSDEIFSNLGDLNILNLSFNKLDHIQEFLFSNLSSLQKVYLSYNVIPTVSSNLLDSLTDLSVLDLSGNPWDCSCALYSLFKFKNSTNVMFGNADEYICGGPKKYSGLKVFSLLMENLPCSLPEIFHESKTMDVLYLTEAHLTCSALGHPEPFVYWITPWGHVFAKETQQHFLKNRNMTLKSHISYFGIPFTTTHVYISRQNTLFIQNFRGYFAGQYTCVAVNEMGESNSTINVTIRTKVPDIYLTSNFVGAGSAGGLLALGIFAGLMKKCAKVVCKCKCDEEDKKLDKIEANENEGIESESPTCTLLSETDYYDDDDFTPTTPLNSPMGRTPRASPRKCVTPTESPEKWRNSTITDTLDEVKLRLERRMDKVRGHVKTIRTTGSQYIQSIKETGSSAYGKMRAGMVLSVEQVKYGYQSIKEFCGTGEMGTQTMSMISVSTDVDTEVKTTVVKSVTRV